MARVGLRAPIGLGLAAVAALTALWWRPAAEPPLEPVFAATLSRPWTRPPNLLLVTICSLRADVLSAAAGEPDGWSAEGLRAPFPTPPTPELDALAAQSVRFRRAWSTATFTAAAHASMFTGLLPAHAGLLDLGDEIRGGLPTLPAVLKLYGYHTLLYTPVPSERRDGKGRRPRGPEGKMRSSKAPPPPPRDMVEERDRCSPPPAIPKDAKGDRPPHPSTLHFGAGFERGVDTFIEGEPDPCEARVIDDLAQAGPWFGLLHLKEAHFPYGLREQDPKTVHPSFASWIHEGPGRRDTEERIRAIHAQLAADPELRALLAQTYGEAAARADAHLGQILDALEEADQLANTLIIVVGDHGESLGDAPRMGHQGNFAPEVLRVPLLIRLPDRSHAGEVVSADVSLTDLFPTLLTAAGATLPALSDGVDLLPLIYGQPAARRPALAQGRVVREGGGRLDRDWIVAGDRSLLLTGQEPGASPAEGPAALRALGPQGWAVVEEPEAEAALRALRAAAQRDESGSVQGAPISEAVRDRLRRDGYW
jgi:arylsulfatase A-like enzyme